MAILDWPRFIGALVLLFVPVQLLHPARTRYRLMDRELFGALVRAFLFPWHWLDFARAMLGAQLLHGAIVAGGYHWVPPATTSSLLHGVVLWLAVTVHLLVFKQREFMPIPLALAMGFGFALLPPLPTALGLVVALAAMLGLQTAMAFFFAAPVAIALFALWLAPDQNLLPLTIFAVACWMVPVLALLFDRRLVLANSPRGERRDESAQRTREMPFDGGRARQTDNKLN